MKYDKSTLYIENILSNEQGVKAVETLCQLVYVTSMVIVLRYKATKLLSTLLPK